VSGRGSPSGWQCPRCYELGRTPVQLDISRQPVGRLRDGAESVLVCLRCADVIWHRLRKVVGPLVRSTQEVEA
jgi:hypothetical protein